MEKDRMHIWCREVAKQVRFGPDRKEIEKELYDHLLEHRDLLMEEGLAQEEAERQAVISMGAPEELGRELDQIHSPLLGWMWKLSSMLMFFALGLMLSGVLSFYDIYGDLGFKDFSFWLETQWDPYLFSNSFADEGEERRLHMPDDGVLMATVMPQSVTFGDYTVSVLEGELMGWRVEDVEEGASPYYHEELTVFLRVECDKPWVKFPRGLHYLNAVDDRGNFYYTSDAYLGIPDKVEKNDAVGRVHDWSSSYVETTMPDWTKALSVTASMPDGSIWQPEWIELYLPDSIGDFRMRLELTYREVTP